MKGERAFILDHVCDGELIVWCRANTSGPWRVTAGTQPSIACVVLSRLKDAVLFKLQWADYIVETV